MIINSICLFVENGVMFASMRCCNSELSATADATAACPECGSILGVEIGEAYARWTYTPSESKRYEMIETIWERRGNNAET